MSKLEVKVRDDLDGTFTVFMEGITCPRLAEEYGRLFLAAPILLELVKQTLHARRCNHPYGQMEKMPTVYALKEAVDLTKSRNPEDAS